MTQTGTLTARVFTSRAQLPVEGATVAVTQRGRNGKYRILSVQQTNRDGATRPIAIPTPTVGESTAPNAGAEPFARCDIWVEHEGYELTVIEDVQIFPGEVSLQQVELEPLVRGEGWTQQTQVRPIPPQSL